MLLVPTFTMKDNQEKFVSRVQDVFLTTVEHLREFANSVRIFFSKFCTVCLMSTVNKYDKSDQL